MQCVTVNMIDVYNTNTSFHARISTVLTYAPANAAYFQDSAVDIDEFPGGWTVERAVNFVSQPGINTRETQCSWSTILR